MSQEAANQARVSLGMGGSFRLVRQRPPHPNATFEDQWDRTPDGTVVPKDRKSIVQDLECHNKWTKRGLAYMVYAALARLGGASVMASEIVSGTTDPVRSLFLMTDVPSPPRPTPYDGDARVTWTESDTANDAKVPPAPTPGDGTSHNLYEGRRGVDFPGDTSDPGIKFVSDAWVGAPPYGEGELIFYAQSQIDSLVKATGYVDFSTVPDDGDYIELDDGLNDRTRFEFDSNNSITEGVPGTDYATAVDITGAPTTSTMATRLAAAINAIGDKLYISAAVDDVVTTRVNLTHYAGGSIGNGDGTAGNAGINIAPATGHFTKSDMAGGTDESMTNRSIDNFPAQSVGIAAGKSCGNGEADSKVAIRTVLGLRGTVQGVCDQRWIHEKFDYGTPTNSEDLHKYVPAETFAAIRGSLSTAAGYVTSGEDTEVVLATFTNGITITDAAPGPAQFELEEAEWLLQSTLGFDETHMRLILRVSSSAVGGNNRDFHIREIVSPQKVRVFETIAGDDDDTSTPLLQVQLVRSYKGENAFDGNVAQEGLTEAPTNHSDPRATVVIGQKWVSASGAGPHMIGRVFDSALSPSGAPKSVKKFRIVAPEGTNVENLPDEFIVEVLDGGSSPPATLPDLLEPANDNHWSTVATYTGGEAADLVVEGRYGKEYTITTPVAGYGFRLSSIRSDDDTAQVEIAQLMLAEVVGAPDGFPIALSGARMKTSVDAGANDVFVDIPDVASTSDVQDLVDALNSAYIGREIEARRSEFGYLWLYTTAQGDNAPFRVYNYGVSGTLGLTSGSDVNRTGLTQAVRKLVMETLTLIYRFSLWGNRPKSV